MVGYLRYRAVWYWLNVIRRRESYCMNAAFFFTARIFLTREELVALIRQRIDDGLLRRLQETSQPPYRSRLEFDGGIEDILCAIWNTLTTRAQLREILISAAGQWLAQAAEEGVEPTVPSADAEQEIEECMSEGLLVPPTACDMPDERAAFVKVAATPVKPDTAGLSGGSGL